MLPPGHGVQQDLGTQPPLRHSLRLPLTQLAVPLSLCTQVLSLAAFPWGDTPTLQDNLALEASPSLRTAPTLGSGMFLS